MGERRRASLFGYVPEAYKRIVRAQLWRHGPIAGALDDLEAMTTQDRVAVWSMLFAWALPEARVRHRFEEFAAADIPLADLKQIARDVPRTRDWFRGSEALERSEAFSRRRHDDERARQLERVLRAYVAYVADADEAADAGEAVYVQGLNGIAFLLLEVMDSEVNAFAFLIGIARKLLPSVFGKGAVLRDAQDTWDEIVSERHSEVAPRCRDAGLSPGLLYVKWMMTMFTQISFSGGTVALPMATVLACWDVAFLMGMAGVAAAMNGIFDEVAAAVSALPRGACEDKILASVAALEKLSAAVVFRRCREQLLQPEGADPLMDSFRASLQQELAVSKSARELFKAAKPARAASSGYLADWQAVREAANEAESKSSSPRPQRPLLRGNGVKGVADDLSQRQRAAAAWMQCYHPESQRAYFVHVSGSWQWDAPCPGFITADGRLALPRGPPPPPFY